MQLDLLYKGLPSAKADTRKVGVQIHSNAISFIQHEGRSGGEGASYTSPPSASLLHPTVTLGVWQCQEVAGHEDLHLQGGRYRVCACTEPHAKRDAAVLLGGKQGRVETAPAALIPEGRMRRNKALNDSKKYLEAARLRGKISSGSSGWTAPTSGTCLCTH